MPLTIDQHDREGCAVLEVYGDLDVATAPALMSAALSVIEAAPSHMVIDVTGLDFCDSAGLAAFVRIAAQLEPRGHRLGIAGPRPIVRRILEVSGLDEAFVVTDTVAEATSRLLVVIP